MTLKEPKEKAKEIFLMFYRLLPLKKEVITYNEHGTWRYEPEEIAKNYSLLHINEMAEAIGTKCSECQDAQNEQLSFWQEVKKEIELL